jgi:hypothetical protein
MCTERIEICEKKKRGGRKKSFVNVQKVKKKKKIFFFFCAGGFFLVLYTHTQKSCPSFVCSKEEEEEVEGRRMKYRKRDKLQSVCCESKGKKSQPKSTSCSN